MIRQFRSRLAHNVISLYGVQIANYVVPLVLVPYLARVLGVAEWGRVAFAQAVGIYVMLVVEFGFSLSATREVARHRDAPDKLAEIVAGVLGAKVVLSAIATGCLLLAYRCTPVLQERPLYISAALVWGLVQAFSMTWFYQGLEQMKTSAALDTLAKVLSAGLVFVFVHSPVDGWKVLVLQAAGSLVGTAVLLIGAYRLVRFRIPDRHQVGEALRMGASMFLFRSAVSFYTAGNVFLLGLFASPEVVGYYAGAEKISRACFGLTQPISNALYPRVASVIHTAREQAVRLARTALMIMAAIAGAIGLAIIVAAPLAVRLLLGHGFEPSIPVLRVFAALPLLVAVSNVYGIQWMLPLGMDKSFNAIIISAGAVNLGLACILVRSYGAPGMAGAAVLAEVFVCVAMYVVLRTRGLDPIFVVRKTEIAEGFQIEG